MEKLGIDLKLLLTQIVNFTIMIVILTKLLYQPILRALKERRKKIEAGLALSQKAIEDEAKLVERKQEMLKEAREETRVILENAKKEGKRLKEEMVAEGKQEIAELRKRMEREMKGKEAEISKELSSQTIDVATAMVKRLLPDILTGEQQHELIYKYLQKIEQAHEK